jgi:hypothetical protein
MKKQIKKTIHTAEIYSSESHTLRVVSAGVIQTTGTLQIQYDKSLHKI